MSETRDPHKLLDHNQVLFIGPDNQLKEVAYILERYPLIKKVVVAELSLKNVIAMSRKAFELGIQDKVEIVRMDFLKVNDLPGFWKGRFSAAFSCRVFEHTINTFEMIGNGWKAIQKVLARPGLFIGHLDLTDQGLAPSSTTDMLTVKEKALQREDDRMVVIADRAMVVKDKVDRGRVSLAYKKLRIDKTQFPQWRQQTQLLQVLEALRDRHWQVGEQVEEVVGEIAKERKDLLGMGVLPIMIDSLINERHVFRDRRSTAIEDAIRNRPDLISESVVSDLMNALKINKYYDVLEPGIKALGDIAAVRGDLINNEAVSILLTLLAHKESSIFEAAAVALGKIIKSRPEYVEEIWSKIPDITKIREEPQLGSAAALLGEIAKSQKTKLETAIQILLKMMNKRSNNVRFYASHALLEIVKAQADSLTQDDIILITKQFKAGRLLDSYGAQIFGEIAKVRAELLKEDVVKVLVEILKSTSTENYKLREICEALGEIARVREDLIQKAEKSLLEMSASDDKNLRKRAVDALVEIVRSKEGPSSGEIIKKLLNLLKIEKEGDVRNDVAAGLVQISEAQPQLLDESIMRAAFDIFNDVDESEWSNGARVLNAFAAVRGDLISPDITSNVRAKLRSKGDNRRSLGLEVIEGIAKMRGDLIDADTVDRVVALLGNENYFGTAFWGLQAFVSIVNSRGDLLTSNHMAAIVKLIVSGNRDFVKTGLSVLISIAKSQGKLIDEDIVKKVIQTLMVKNREEPKQGIAALVAIAQSRSDLRKGIVKTMIELLENKENYVRAKALEVLRKLVQSGTAVHLSKIVMRRIESLMGDDDWEVRQAAVGLMGEITKNASLDAQLGEDMKMFIMDQDHGFGLRPEDLSEGWSLLNAFGNQNDSWGIALFLDIIHEMSDYDQKIALVGLGNFYYQLKRFPKFIEILKASQGNVRELFQQLKDGVEDVTHSEDRIGDGWDGVSARLAEASQWKGPVLTGFIDKIIVTLRLLRQGAGRDLGFRQNANIEFRFPELKQNLITVLNNTQVPYQLKRRLFTSLPLGDAQEIDDLRNRAVLLVGEVTGLHQDNRTGLVGEIRQRIHNNPSVQDLPVVTAYREWVDSDGKRGTDKLIRFGLQVTPQDRVAPQRKTAVLAACDELLSSLRQVYGGGSEESLQRVIPVWQRAVGASSPAAEIRQGIEEVLQEGNFSEALLKLSDIRYRLKNMMQDMRGEALYQSIKLDLRLEIVLYRLFNSLEEKSKMTPQVLASMLRNLEASGYDRDLLEKKLTDLETITQGTNNDLKMYSWVKGLERFIQQEASESIEDYQALAESTARQLRVAPEDEIWVENFSSNLFRGDSIFLVSGLLNQMKNAVMTRAGISGWQVIVPGDMNGKLHYISDLKNINTLQDDEILVVDRLPSDSPVIKRARGIITLQEDSLLSHPAIRARQHGIPFLFCPDKKLIAEYFGQAVSIEVKGEDWVILKPSSDKEVVAKTGSEITPIILPKVVEEGAFIIEPDEYSASTVGNKAFNLGTMGSSRHLGLSFALYKRVLEDKENKAVKNQIKKIEDELANNPLDEGATKERLWQLRQLVNSLVIGQAIIQEISGAIIRRLGSGLIFLRSSTNAEDLLGYAGAGLYDSFGAVDPTDTVMLEKYIKKVWASVYNTRAYEDRQLNGIEHRDVRMAILAHKMVYVENTEGNIPQFSAVIHTRNPSSDNPQEMVVEIVQGLGEALVSGANEYQGSPYRFSYNRLTKAIKILAYANKDYRLVVQNRKLRRIFTDYRNDIFYLDSEKRNLILKEMFENAQRIEKNASGRSQDIEDCLIAVPQGYHLIDVQSRDQQGRQDKAQLAQLPVITAKKRRIKEFEILARQKAPVTVSQLIALLRAKNGYADVKADHVSKDVARDDRLKSHDKLIVKELDLEAVMARRAKELEILDRQKKPVTVSQLIALLRAEDGYADVKEGAVRYDVDYYLKGHDKISVREVDWKVVTARRAQELEILARQKTPVTVSQLIALLRAQDGYANVKTADVKNDVVLDEHLKGHNKLKKEVDQKAVAARRDKEVEILDRQETPVTVNQLIALLRAEDGYADVEADHVRADVARDERLKSHDKLIVKELDLEAVMARRDKEVEILARQKKPVTVSQLTTLLRAEDGYADVKVDTVRSDVAVDEHLKGPDKLKIGLEREVVAARHAKELEILARQKAPVTVSQLIALLRAENGYADLKAENVSNDVALYEPLKSHDKLIRRELDRKVVAARRTKELEILARQEAPVTVSQLTTLLRAEEGYADVKLGDVKNDVTHDQHLKGNDKLKKTVDRKAVAERLEAQELRELKQWIDGHSNRNITSVKLNSILAEFPHISRQTVEEDLSRSHIGIKDGVQLILDKAMEADRSGEEVTNNAGTSSQIPDEMTWGTIRTPWRTYPMTVKEDQDGTKKYIVSTGDFVFVKSKGVPVKLETRNVSSCTGIGIRIKNGKDEYYALAHIYNVHLVKAVSLIEQIRSIHTFLETVLGLNASRMDYVVDYRTDEYKEDSESSEQSIREEFTRSNFKFHRRIPYKIIDGVKVSSYPIDHISVTKHGVTIVANNQRTAPLLYEWSEAIGSGQTIGDRAMKAKGLDPDILSRAELYKDFLLQIGVRRNANIVDAGTGTSITVLTAAAMLGAHYVGFDLREDSKPTIDIFLSRHDFNQWGGTVEQRLGAFAINSPASRDIKDHSQDFVLMLTGVLSDPRPESDGKKALQEALRVINNHGKIAIGTFGFLGWERGYMQDTLESVLNSKEWEGKVRLVETPWTGERHIGATSIMNVYEVVFQDDKAMGVHKEKTGGIDLTPANMNVEIKKEIASSLGIKFHLDSAMLAQLQNAPGFVPVIINIQPVGDLKQFLGLSGKNVQTSG